MTNSETGLKVLKAFWSSSRAYHSSFKLSFDEFLTRLQPNVVKRNIEINGLGFGVLSAEMSDSRIDSAMSNLAKRSGGKIPSGIQPFFQVLSNESTKINLIDAVVQTTAGSLSTIAGGAQDLGDSLISSAKFLNFILPLIIVGGVLLLAYSWIDRTSGGDATRFLKSARKGFK